MLISKREEIRANKLRVALAKWEVISTGKAGRPSVNVLAYLAGLSQAFKFEVNNILKGGI